MKMKMRMICNNFLRIIFTVSSRPFFHGKIGTTGRAGDPMHFLLSSHSLIKRGHRYRVPQKLMQINNAK